jgi:penicillin-binding protein 1C
MTGRPTAAFRAAAARLARWARRRPYAAASFALAAAAALYCVWPPGQLFTKDYSSVIEDRDGAVLYVSAAKDGQVRFPPGAEKLPGKYVAALLVKEDKRYFRHFGVDVRALARALWNNGRGKGRKSGASTITMQVARMSGRGDRTLFNKFREMVLAFRIELYFSKERILRLYAANVPMGGNVVGVESAAYRFLGHPLQEMTWAEAALLTVLPNSPSGMNLERRRDALRNRRDLLLRRLFSLRKIDSLTCASALEEPLPQVKRFRTFCAPHAGFAASALRPGERVRLTIKKFLQERAEELLALHHKTLESRGIANAAVLVVETATGRVAAYVGSQDYNDTTANGRVDGVRAYRSPGSLLKPFLYAKMLDCGEILADAKVHDIPTYYGTFSPANSSREFSGLVSVRSALVQSLNVPAVRCLNLYGLDDFYWFLKQVGLAGLFRTPEGYGLPIILGSCEASLWELTQLYTDLGNLGERQWLTVTQGPGKERDHKRLYSAGAAWQVLGILSQLSRPEAEYYWRYFNNQVPVAWKTGTSYGQKDAWAIGTNAQWTIGVWSGNFTGRGNAFLSGGASSGPLLFMLFNEFTDRNKPMWPEEPWADLVEVAVCASSGYRATDACPATVISKHPRSSETIAACPFHRKFLVCKSKGFGVCSLCWDLRDTAWVTREIYPPSLAAFYRAHGRACESAPLHNPACPAVRSEAAIEILYPPPGVRIFVPRNIAGEYEKVVLRAAHGRKSATLFWYLDDRFMGATKEKHELAIDLKNGNHELFVQDEEGNAGTAKFLAIRK